MSSPADPIEYEPRRERFRRGDSPWLWVPTLFFLQALPNTLITSVFPIAFRNLGIDIITITAWTPLVSLPWLFKLLWAPVVDCWGQKRGWVLVTQGLIFLLSSAAAAGVMLPSPFYPVLALLLILATLSATHDIAADGLYLLALPKQTQASFVGVLTTSARLGRLFANGAIVYLAGILIKPDYGLSAATAWAITFFVAAVLYGGMALWHFFALPRANADRNHTPPPATSIDVEIESPAPGAGDAPAGESPTLHYHPSTTPTPPATLSSHLLRTLLVVFTGVCLWALLSVVIRLTGHALSKPLNIPAWEHTPAGVLGWGIAGIMGLLLLPPSFLLSRSQLRNTEMGSALSTYFKQPRFPAILFFILTYRLSELLIGAITQFFLIDQRANGGLAISTRTLGTINGVAGTIGIILGGLAGGVFISRHGLRRAFLPLVLAMALPNVLYILAAKYPDFSLSPQGGAANAHLYGLIFIDQFGYGFGFAGYFVYLMYIAQRNPRYTTTHYAIGTGLGALTIVLATALSGILQSALGYTAFFTVATLLAIPGMVSLLLIPMDPTHARGIRAEVD